MKMQYVVSILVCCTALPAPLYAEHHCREYTDHINAIEARMRQPYTVQTGEYLKRRLTTLKDRRIACERLAEEHRHKVKTTSKPKPLPRSAPTSVPPVKVPKNQWHVSSPDADRIRFWQELQMAEHKKFEQLKEKLKGSISEEKPKDEF